jgi:hypothetical protein
LAGGALGGRRISAAATDEANATLGTTGGKTSEFSADVQAHAFTGRGRRPFSSERRVLALNPTCPQ